MHIAIIPDGNRRWAKKNGLAIIEGHKYSAQHVIPEIIDYLKDKVEYVTFWALSSENYKNRTKQEIQALLVLLKYFLRKKEKELIKNQIRVKIIGDTMIFPDDFQKLLSEIEKKTARFHKHTIIFALNYSGRDEIVRAVNNKIHSKKRNIIIDEKSFSRLLDTKDIPDPDIIIRTGKEMRLSGFLIWQSAYSELFFTPKYFPDFTIKDLESVIKEYSKRTRRFGI